MSRAFAGLTLIGEVPVNGIRETLRSKLAADRGAGAVMEQQWGSIR